MSRIGAYPGSFNPPTIAHLAIADAARRQRRLSRVELVLSTLPLGKQQVELPVLEHRVEVLEALARRVGWLSVRVTGAQLVADIAEGYDVVIMGADKWAQLNDPAWYGGPAQRDRALARLPELAVAWREGHHVPEPHRLDVAPHLAAVSSSAARAGQVSLMVPEALEFARSTGAWLDEARYRTWLAAHRAPR